MPVTTAYTSGQIPIYYNHRIIAWIKEAWFLNYVDMRIQRYYLTWFVYTKLNIAICSYKDCIMRQSMDSV